MSVVSMTGYGHGRAVLKGVHAEAEVSSVNRKQFDLRISAPRSLAALEGRIAGIVGGSVSRGSVNVSVVLRSLSPSVCRVRLDEGMALAFVAEIRRVAAKAGLRDDLGARALLSLPDLVSRESLDVNAEAVWPAVEAALKKALQGLVSMRRTEGRALRKAVCGSLGTLRRNLQATAKLADRAVENCRKKLGSRLERAGVQGTAMPAELAREIATLAEKSDVSEEIARLASHLDQADSMIEGEGSRGRSLDFLAQEILREINTIASKADDGEITRLAVAMKSALECFREQVQNIE